MASNDDKPSATEQAELSRTLTDRIYRRLREPDVFAYVSALGLGAIVLTIGILWGTGPQDTTQAILRGFGITLITVAFLALLPIVASWRIDGHDRRLFKQFFGQMAPTAGIFLVSGGRTMDEAYLEHLRPKPPVQLNPECMADDVVVLPTAVDEWVAQEDVRAASHLALKLNGMFGVQTHLRTADTYSIELSLSNSIGIGLAFNQHTRDIATSLGADVMAVTFEAVDDPETIVDPETKRTRRVFTDGFEVNGKRPTPRPGWDAAVIVRRVHPNFRGRVQFIVAGTTGHGTAVAGWFLAHSWKEIDALYDRYEKDRALDSMAVVLHHRRFTHRAVNGDADGELDPEHIGWSTRRPEAPR